MLKKMVLCLDSISGHYTLLTKKRKKPFNFIGLILFNQWLTLETSASLSLQGGNLTRINLSDTNF